MKTILLTGCNGQLGRAIQKEYQGEPVEFVCTDVVAGADCIKLDITDVVGVEAMTARVRPEVIINCAAHTGVDACESEWDSAYRINALGPRNLSIAAAKYQAKLIHVSTDYVFSGDGSKPYTEFDIPNPQGAYGKTKLEGERFVEKFAGRYFIIRTAWLYGEGNNFVKTMLRLAETNAKVRVVSDQFGSPTSTKELAKLIHVLEPSENYGLFHGTCGGNCSWAEFAEEIFALSGRDTQVEHITTAEYKTPAKRPAYSVLDNYMLQLTSAYRMADWKDAIREYLTSGQ